MYRDWRRRGLHLADALQDDVLTLSAWEGLTSAEIAVVVGLPPSTVRTRLARARATVRSMLAVETTA